MDTGVVIAVAAVLFLAVIAVLVCIFSSAAGTVSAIKQTNDEDSEA